MTSDWQVVFDAHNPHTTADFWAAALGYSVEHHAGFIEGLLAQGGISETETVTHNGVLCFRDLVAIAHPDDLAERHLGTGSARRILFQRVPEAKVVKNRVHIDINVGSALLRGEVERLVSLGATVIGELNASGSHFFTLTDLEGNEFDVQ